MQIYVGRNGQREGPFTLDQIRTMLAQGQAQPTDLAWYEGAAGWIPVAQLPGLHPPPLGAVPPPLQPVPASFAPTYGTPQPTETLSIVSLILGILGLIMIPFVASVPGAVCGHMALGRIKRAAGVLGGKGMAIAGLITSYLGMLFWGGLILVCVLMFAGMLGIAAPFLSEMKDGFSTSKALVEASTIHSACTRYATDHDGNFPPKLETLVPQYLHSDAPLHTSLGGMAGYEYFGGTLADPPDKVLFQSRGTVLGNQHIVGRVGGGVVLEEPAAPQLEDAAPPENPPKEL
jgi:hypothetical protein